MEEGMQRPGGVTVVAVVLFVWSCVEVLAACGFVIWMLSQRTSRPDVTVLFVGALVILFVAGLASINAVAGYGLWKLRNWGRVMTLILCSIIAIGMTTQLLAGLQRPAWAGVPSDADQFRIYFSLAALAACGWVIYYLTRQQVKQAFGSSLNSVAGGVKEG
jgi:hypothetical protein